MLRRAIGCFGTCVAGLLCLGASPSRGNVALEYRGPPGCPGEATFRDRTEDMYDFQEVFVPDGPGTPFLLQVTIEHIGTGYRGTIKLLNEDGSVRARIVELHEHCDALTYLVAHRVRLMVSPDRPAPPPAPPPETERGPRDQRVSRRLDRLEETTEDHDEKIKALDQRIRVLNEQITRLEREKMDLTYTLAAGALMTLNLTSNVGPGVWVSGGLWSGPLGLGLDLRAVLPSRVVIGPHDADLSQFVGLLTPCGRYSIFFGCAVAGAGVQIDADTDVELAPGQSATQFGPLVQLGGRVGVEVPLGETRFAIRGWGEILYSTPAVEYSYSDGSSAYRPDVSGFIGLGFVVKLGDQQEGAK
jgi:hypothetical protein